MKPFWGLLIWLPLFEWFISIWFISIICYKTVFMSKWWQGLPSRSFVGPCCWHMMMDMMSIKRAIRNSSIWCTTSHGWGSTPPTIAMSKPLSSSRFIPTVCTSVAKMSIQYYNCIINNKVVEWNILVFKLYQYKSYFIK